MEQTSEASQIPRQGLEGTFQARIDIRCCWLPAHPDECLTSLVILLLISLSSFGVNRRNTNQNEFYRRQMFDICIL